MNTVEFDAALVEDVAAQDNLVVEEFAAVAVNFYRSDGCVADRQIEIGRDTLIRFTADALNNGGGTADLQLQGGDDCKRDQCAIGACVEKGVNCGAGEWGLPVRTCELYENNWSLRNAGFQGLIGILHGMEALGKSSATNHDSGFLFEHLADEQVLVRALGKNPLGEGLFVGIVI